MRCDEPLIRVRWPAIFGGGYAIDRLGSLPWLRDKLLYYWGDIDTHGFAILSRLRRRWAHTRSLLMDRDTLLEHTALWSEEPRDRRCLHELDALDDEERALYDDLRFDRLAERVRLEQERIGYLRVLEAVATIRRQEFSGGKEVEQ